MHGVAAHQQEFGPGLHKIAAGTSKQRAALSPLSGALEGRDLLEIEGMQQDARGMQPAKPLLHFAIDDAVIDGRGFQVMPPRRPMVFIGIPKSIA